MTAQEFITAVEAGGTIEVDSDIDFNDYYFSSTIVIPAGTIINGAGHTLTNIQQGSSNIIFQSSNCTLNNINIRNLNIPNGTLFYSNNSVEFSANECQISGYIYRIHYGANLGSYGAMTFNRCSLNINRYLDINATLRECYVVLENNIIKGSTTSYNYFGYGVNTYYKGKLSNADGAITSSSNLNNCCIKIHTKANDKKI